MRPFHNQPYLILDGPTGTELSRRGYELDPVLWTAQAAHKAPQLLLQIHKEYLEAGANILTANTFRTTSYTLEKAGHAASDAKVLARKLTHASVAIATDAIEQKSGQAIAPHFLAGSMAPLEDCYQPRLVPILDMLERRHAEHAENLVEAGCDLLLAETMGTAREALIAVRAARKAGASAVAVSFIVDPTGKKLLGGDDLRSAAVGCVESGAEVVLINCAPVKAIGKALEVLQPIQESGAVIGAYANADSFSLDWDGSIQWQKDDRDEQLKISEYAESGVEWARRSGARLFGGCCGTNPAYIRRLATQLAVFFR